PGRDHREHAADDVPARGVVDDPPLTVDQPIREHPRPRERQGRERPGRGAEREVPGHEAAVGATDLLDPHDRHVTNVDAALVLAQLDQQPRPELHVLGHELALVELLGAELLRRRLARAHADLRVHVDRRTAEREREPAEWAPRNAKYFFGGASAHRRNPYRTTAWPSL